MTILYLTDKQFNQVLIIKNRRKKDVYEFSVDEKVSELTFNYIIYFIF